MRRALAVLVLAAAGLLAQPAAAVNPDEVLPDPVQEHRAREISKELRCLVCQNQSIDDSDAGLARDLRLIVRERIADGDSDQQVLQFVVDRYGDFVLLKPPFKPYTYVLWFGPAALLGIAVLGVVNFYRRRASAAEPGAAPLSAEERRRIEVLLAEADETK